MARKNPWDATDYKVGDKIQVRGNKDWYDATVAKIGGWRMHVRYPSGVVFAIDSPRSVRRRK